ncbi:hypothetical protein Bca52824_039089 [Brassica carinata]|uniref:Uncharacterized protein n=1 Tax=Brassica carinata TaxID=52824 RepID=A0A8X7RT16_BRACI|nr:hypothetical protein Bca52824_039089 [Brassica carinata]
MENFKADSQTGKWRSLTKALQREVLYLRPLPNPTFRLLVHINVMKSIFFKLYVLVVMLLFTWYDPHAVDTKYKE